jgi:hypothetical protein
MSEIYGRNVIYRYSFALFFVCMFPVAFAPDICTLRPLFLLCEFGSFGSGMITVMRFDSCVSGLSVYRRVQRGGVSQRGLGKCQ